MFLAKEIRRARESKATSLWSFETTVVLAKEDPPMPVALIAECVLRHASFDGGTEVAYVGDQLSGEVIEDAEDVARLRRMLDVFRADALSRRESAEPIRKTRVERWQGQ